MDIDCLLDCRAELGEGPVWDCARRVLDWVNIKAREIHRTVIRQIDLRARRCQQT